MEAGGHVAAGKTLTSEQSYADQHKEAEFQERSGAGTFLFRRAGPGSFETSERDCGGRREWQHESLIESA